MISMRHTVDPHSTLSVIVIKEVLDIDTVKLKGVVFNLNLLQILVSNLFLRFTSTKLIQTMEVEFQTTIDHHVIFSVNNLLVLLRLNMQIFTANHKAL